MTHLLRILCSASAGNLESGQPKFLIDFRHQPEQLEILIVGTGLNFAGSTQATTSTTTTTSSSSAMASLSQGYVAFSQASGDLRSGLSLGLALAMLGRCGASIKQYQNSKQQGFQISLPLV